ncbi:MAG: hypothetical protein ACK5T0_00395 [Vampirovibrionales bacterium]
MKNVPDKMPAPAGKMWIYPRYIRKNGKIIYPRGTKWFAFLVDIKKQG